MKRYNPVCLCILIASGVMTAAAQPTRAAPIITSLTLNPAVISGGSGGITTATVTLDTPAPAGGTTLTISSSNVELAASVPSITVPEGATSAEFVVGTNAIYRRYSGLAFTVVISVTNPANGSTQSTTLTVTAQDRPPDVIGPDSDMTGLNCGGQSPDVNILTDCERGPNNFTPGPCGFVEECLLGCQDLPDEGLRLNAECGQTPPSPVAVTPNYVVGGTTVDGACFLSEPAPEGSFAFAQSNSPFAQTSSPVNMPFETGATSVGFTVATQAVGVPSFVAIVARSVARVPHPDGGTFFSARSGLAWLALAPPANAPHPVLQTLTLNPATVQECDSAQGTITLDPAPAGAVQVFLSSDRTDVVSIPNELPFSVIVPTGATSVTFTVRTRSVTADTFVNISATFSGVTRTAALLVTDRTGPSLTGLSLNPSTVVGGNSSTGTVTLSGSAPTGGVEVRLSSTFPSIVSVPPSVTVPAGQTSASFTVATSPVTSSTIIGVTATLGCISQSASLMVTTPPPPPSLWALSLNPVLVVGGESSTGTVTLTSAAPSEGFEVALSSSNASVATVPASVIVPGGSGSTTFTVNTNPVEASTSVDFTATAGDVIRTAQLTVQPFTPETETVTFSGRIERNSTRTHSVNVTAAGEGSARLSWQDNRVSLSLTVRNPSGTAIAWGSGSNPMQVGFTAVQTGTYTFEINNPSNRKTDYTLQVTYPVGSAPPADTTPPTVSISAPANGATVSGTVTISASASDNVGVTRVEFFVDGVLVGSDATAPYSVAWDTTQYADGSHTLTARAFDAAGNQATSAAVSVTVANDAGGGDDPPVLDLSVSGIPTSIRRGEFFTATATVTNSGGSTASGLSVVISWQPSDAIRLESPRGSTQSVSSVAPGGSQSVSWLIRADRAGSATITLTLRDSNGVTVDVVSQGLTIQN